MSTKIHPTAIIDSSANIAQDAHVGPYVVIGAEVEIGEGTRIGAHTIICGSTIVGAGNRIFQHAVLGEEPQDLGYQDEDTRLVIGEHNVIREYVSINRGTLKGGGVTKIGNDNYLMAYTHIGHDCQIGSNNIFTNSTSLSGHVEVNDHCNLGGFTLLHQFTRIGSYAFTSMGSAINLDVPPFVIVSGNYARSYGINKLGLQRKGFTPERIGAIGKAYKLLVRKRTERDQALAQLKPLAEQYSEVQLFIDFVLSSPRGIVK
jgi:UDP-N-acetylglucosamine acyltransferase